MRFADGKCPMCNRPDKATRREIIEGSASVLVALALLFGIAMIGNCIVEDRAYHAAKDERWRAFWSEHYRACWCCENCGHRIMVPVRNGSKPHEVERPACYSCGVENTYEVGHWNWDRCECPEPRAGVTDG